MQSGSAREEKRDWEDCTDALSLLLSSFFSTFTKTHTCKHARQKKKNSHLLPLPCATGDSFQRAPRQGVEAGEWRDIGGGGR